MNFNLVIKKTYAKNESLKIIDNVSYEKVATHLVFYYIHIQTSICHITWRYEKYV